MMAGAYEGGATIGQKVDTILKGVFSGKGDGYYKEIFEVIEVHNADLEAIIEIDEVKAKPYFEKIFIFVENLIEYFLFSQYRQIDKPLTRAVKRKSFEYLYTTYVERPSAWEQDLLDQFDAFLTDVIANPKLIDDINKNQIRVGGDDHEEVADLGKNQASADLKGSGTSTIQKLFLDNIPWLLSLLTTKGSKVKSIILSITLRVLGPATISAGADVARFSFRKLFDRESTDQIVKRLKLPEWSALKVEDLTDEKVKENIDSFPALRQMLVEKKTDEEKLTALPLSRIRHSEDERGRIRAYKHHKEQVETLRKQADALFEIMYANRAEGESNEEEIELARFINTPAFLPSLDYNMKRALCFQLLLYYCKAHQKVDIIENKKRNMIIKFNNLYPERIPP